jgi:hypothetical protein
VIDGSDAERYGHVSTIVKGRLATSADAGSTVTLHAEEARGSASYTVHGTGVTRIENTHFSAGRYWASGITVAGDLYAENCSADGLGCMLEAEDGAVTVSGGTFAGRLNVYARDDVLLRDGVRIQGRALEITCARGAVWVGGDVVVEVVRNVTIESDGDVALANGARIVVTEGNGFWDGVHLTAGTGRVYVREGALIDAGGANKAYIDGASGVDIAGSVRSGRGCFLTAGLGDVVLRDGALLDTGDGRVEVLAGGTIAAEGGTASITAAEFELVSETGGLDLDLSSLRATSGRIVALSNGVVKLRGEYEAARDIQIISRRDGIDVAGASLATVPVAGTISGFVRLATYSSNAPIDAHDATIRTGTSDVQSGDVLLQIAAEGGETAPAKMKVSGATARRSRDGTVVTRVRGTLTSGRRAVNLRGSGQVTAGELGRRVFLRGRGGRLSGESDVVRLDVAGGTSSRANFVITLREPETAEGTRTALRFDRAGLHAATTFRRPRVR